MPIYDFKCDDCGHKFGKLVPVGTHEAPCDSCSKAAKKLLSAPAIHFSGSGFYVSDSRGGSENKSNPASSSKPESGSSTPTSSGSKNKQ